MSVEELWHWLRRVYDVTDPPVSEHVLAFDRVTHEPVGAWEAGGKVPDELYARYLDEVPGARDKWKEIQ